ncbi:MAG: M10 family metallopeptidase C-terminal domain-containing protein [Nostoc sp. TH1S01]|nr:M10 family metallopeptidase C-terminal domain-containing protein [Nostoc sp. TH1S01]
MSSDTLFLQPTSSTTALNPNYVNATGSTSFLNYSHRPSGTLTNAQTATLVKGGVAVAGAEAGAIIFQDDPTFSTLFTNSDGIGVDGAFTGSASSETKVVASFEVGKNSNFSFEFSANLSLIAQEIENPDTEYNQANSRIGFLVLDTTNPDKPKGIDYFGINGKLISSKQIGITKFGGSKNVNIISSNEVKDINGNNGEDLITDDVFGSYQKYFKKDTRITLVQINVSEVKFAGDTLIGNLGEDVIYGTIWNDKLRGTNGADKIYGSLGNDQIKGKKGDDILEGGQGNDLLDGGKGNDQLYGGSGDDILIGGKGNDVLVGGEGYDQFIFRRGHSFIKGEFDVIEDFEASVDKIVFQGLNQTNASVWLAEQFSLGHISNTQDGLLFSLNSEKLEGQLLVKGLTFNDLNSSNFVFG